MRPTTPAWDAALADRANHPVQVSGQMVTRPGISPDVRDLSRAVELVVTRELAGDAPEEVTFLGGGAITEASATLDLRDGAPHPADSRDRWLAGTFSPDAGYDGDLQPLFRGVTREANFTEDTRYVTWKALGLEERCRQPVALPAFGAVKDPTFNRLSRYPTNASAVVVAALHAAGIRYTPAPRANCIISVPLAFGALADIGWVAPKGTGVPPGASFLTQGRFGSTLATMPSWQLDVWPSGWSTWRPGCRFMAEFFYSRNRSIAGDFITIKLGSTGEVRVYGTSSGTVQVLARQTWTQSWTTLGTWTEPDGGWHHWCIALHQSGSWSLRRDATVVMSGSWSPPSAVGHYPVHILLETGRMQALAAYLVDSTTALTVPDTSILDFTPQADVEQSALTLEALPEIQSREAWDLIREIAGAEFAAAGFDESGRFSYRSRTTVNASTSPVLTLDTETIDRLDGSARLDSVRTAITTTAPRPRLEEYPTGSTTSKVAAFVADQPLAFPDGHSSTIIDVGRPVQLIDGKVYLVQANPGGVYDLPASMVICSDANGNNVYTNAGTYIWATAHPIGPNTIRLEVENTTGVTMYAVWPKAFDEPSYTTTPFGVKTGDPAFFIASRHAPAKDIPPAVVNVTDPTATTAWGTRVLKLDETPWRQDKTATTALAETLLSSITSPRLDIDDVTIPGDLRLQLADPIMFRDPAGLVPDIRARVTRIQHRFSRAVEGGHVTTISARTI